MVGRRTANTAPASEDRWGTLVYMDERGKKTEEKVPVDCAHYERIYDSLVKK